MDSTTPFEVVLGKEAIELYDNDDDDDEDDDDDYDDEIISAISDNSFGNFEYGSQNEKTPAVKLRFVDDYRSYMRTASDTYTFYNLEVSCGKLSSVSDLGVGYLNGMSTNDREIED